MVVAGCTAYRRSNTLTCGLHHSAVNFDTGQALNSRLRENSSAFMVLIAAKVCNTPALALLNPSLPARHLRHHAARLADERLHVQHVVTDDLNPGPAAWCDAFVKHPPTHAQSRLQQR